MFYLLGPKPPLGPPKCNRKYLYELIDDVNDLIGDFIAEIFNSVRNTLTLISFGLLSLLTQLTPAVSQININKIKPVLNSVNNSSLLDVLTAVLKAIKSDAIRLLPIIPECLANFKIDTQTVLRLLQFVTKNASSVAFVLFIKSLVAIIVRSNAPTCAA